jgi:hypothetical protein
MTLVEEPPDDGRQAVRVFATLAGQCSTNALKRPYPPKASLDAIALAKDRRFAAVIGVVG